MGFGNSTEAAYHYGDKIPARGYWNSYYDQRYRSNKYNNLYNPEKRQYNPDNQWHRYHGWGF